MDVDVFSPLVLHPSSFGIEEESLELKSLFNAWAKEVDGDYAQRQWLLSKWELFEGIAWPKEKYDTMIRSIAVGLQLQSGDNLIDLGCGGGWILKARSAYAKRGVVGLDFSGEMLRFARQTLPETPLINGEIGRLPLKSESFAKALSYYVFLNFADDAYVEQGILEVWRVLKKGGRALIGQLPDKNGSAAYEAAKAEHLEFCRRTYPLGKNNRDTHLLPLRLFDKDALSRSLNERNIRHQFLDSFNPFFRSGQPALVNWRFDLVLEK